MRIKCRVFVIKTGDEPERNLRFRGGINKASAELAAVERPACRMDHLSFLDAAWRDIPKLLDPKGIGLGIAIAIQVEPADQLVS